MRFTRNTLTISVLFATFLAAVAPAQWVSHGPTDAGLNAVSIGALALDPQNPSTIWAGGIGPGLFRSTDTGLSWSPAGELPGAESVSALAIDPENPRTMYARAYGIHWTEDGGETWTPSLSNSLVGYFLAPDPADHRRIWTGSDAGIYFSGSGLHYSDDGARTFRSVPSVTQTIYSILFDQRRPGSIYGGSYDRVIEQYSQAVGGSIFVSRDNGATFTKGATNFGSRVVSMAADPFEDILYAATAGIRGSSVFRSLDGGTTWEAAAPFGYLLKIIVDPVRRGRLYASTTNGVFRSTDAARTWEHIGLTNTSGEIVITPDGRWLYAGTSGGVFQLDLELAALDVSSGAAGRSRILFWDSGQLSVQTLAESGSWTSTPFEGPYSGWKAIAIADGSDGLSRVLWQNVDGRVGLELVGPAGKVDAFRFDAEPGWKAIDVSLGSDGRTHLLRTSADGKMRITSVDSSGSAVEGQLYGPYDGWSAHAMDDGPDGATWVLWQRVNGHAGIARYRAGTVETAFRWDANPGWSAEDIAVGADGVARVLWTNPDGRMEITSVDGQGHLFDRKVHSNVGLKARRIAGSPDGLTRVLWTGMDRGSSLWILNPDNSLKSQDPIPAP